MKGGQTMQSFNSRKFNDPEEPENNSTEKHARNHITFNFTFNIGNTDFHFEQRAEGGGQINEDVGTNANQGGQNASDGSHTRNVNSQFADGNGRSGIAGNNNDEAGGQQGIKVRDSLVIDSDIHSSSNHSESHEEDNDLTEETEE
ncbi:hypothetical protein P799_23105 [Lysinibacillus sphaericus CBAM5]|uniref:Uncharacterized protein n=3 Tax=Lysinibacillus TaxID=400634 RepID=B1HTZ8_LYSSC|nr:hypothetical protein Bsph_0260 [Lysinibacillus sphaericus C3-41]EWH30736.1 hypothetical protein P799_23105 [Lysinibacillus sphaericus CBAM5]